MLVALATQVCNSLPPQKGKISLYTGSYRTFTERAEFLPMLLAINNCCLECCCIKIFGDWWQAFIGQGSSYGRAGSTIKREGAGCVIHMVILNAVRDELADYLGKRH